METLGNIDTSKDLITVHLDLENPIKSLKTLIHELLHYNSFQTFMTHTEDENAEFRNMRVGLRVKGKLTFLNEGLTEYFTNKDIYTYLKNNPELKEASEDILKKFKLGELSEMNVESVTKPSYLEEVRFIKSLKYMLKWAYDVDDQEVEQWYADAYFKGNLLQLFKKIKKVTDRDFVNKFKEIPHDGERSGGEWESLVQRLNEFSDLYDGGIEKTIPDDEFNNT